MGNTSHQEKLSTTQASRQSRWPWDRWNDSQFWLSEWEADQRKRILRQIEEQGSIKGRAL